MGWTSWCGGHAGDSNARFAARLLNQQHVRRALADRDLYGTSTVLFLDEIHRLPPEGQEMLFRLIDKGLVRRLGESGKERPVQVMLIGATTERPDSVLLATSPGASPW